MRLINIGFGSMVAANRLIAIISPDSAPVRRVIQEARDKGLLIDASFGRSTKSVVVMDSGNIILSSLSTDIISARIAEKNDEEVGLCDEK